VVNCKSVQLNEVLDEVQSVGRVWFKNILIQGLKGSIRLKMSHMTIIICKLIMLFILI
jgi:hypothetical protein